MSKAAMYVRILVLSGLVVLLGLIHPLSHLSAQTSSQSVGFVRFAHTAIDVGPVDIYQGDSAQKPIITNLAYGQVTDFLTLNATTSDFVARPTGSGPGGKILVRANWGVKANESTILIVAGLASNVEILFEPILIVRDDLKDRARVRVVNMVWGSKLTVRTNNNQVLGQNLGPIGIFDLDLAPGTYPLEVVDATGKTLANMTGVDLKANTANTILLLGNKDGTPAMSIMNVVSQQDTTRVKILNKTSGPVDIYIKATGKVLAANLANGADTGFVTLPSGEMTFQARQAGSAPDSMELAALPTQLRPQRDVTIVINANRSMEITEETLTPPGEAAGVNTEATAAATAAATEGAGTTSVPQPAATATASGS